MIESIKNHLTAGKESLHIFKHNGNDYYYKHILVHVMYFTPKGKLKDVTYRLNEDHLPKVLQLLEEKPSSLRAYARKNAFSSY